MSVHPPELRWRVVSAYEGGEGSYEELAERLVVARSTVQEWMGLYRATGGLSRFPQSLRTACGVIYPLQQKPL